MNTLITTLTDFTGQVSGLLWKNPLTLIILLGVGVLRALKQDYFSRPHRRTR